jgi:hypothetical protein
LLPLPSGDRMLTAPVFIFSGARSGSTLLRVILGSHSQLYAPPELPLAHLEARAETRWIETSMKALYLTKEELDHMLWDRVLADALARSGKPFIVVKTPSNVLLWRRIADCWPDARFIFLLRHPAAAVVSLRASWAPTWHPDRSDSLDEVNNYALQYMTKVEEARHALTGHTVRYEDLTADPETVVGGVCRFLGVPFEPAMLDYGQFADSRFAFGLGDNSATIRSGRIQAATPPPRSGEITPALAEMCAAWDYPSAAEHDLPGGPAPAARHGGHTVDPAAAGSADAELRPDRQVI